MRLGIIEKLKREKQVLHIANNLFWPFYVQTNAGLVENKTKRNNRIYVTSLKMKGGGLVFIQLNMVTIFPFIL